MSCLIRKNPTAEVETIKNHSEISVHSNAVRASRTSLKNLIPLSESVFENSLSRMNHVIQEILFVLFSLLANKADHPLPKHITDKYLTSEKWLQKYGLKAQKLTLYDALADCVFRHVDGLVDIKTKPEDECSQTDAVSIVNFPSHPVSCSFLSFKA